MRPEFEHLTEGRHVYYWPNEGDKISRYHRAAIVADVQRGIDNEPDGVVALFVLGRDGSTFRRLGVKFFEGEDSPVGSGCWTWMFPEQSRVSTAGARPTALQPPAEQQAAAMGGMLRKDDPDPWKHRSAGMRCKTCMWFAPKIVVEKERAIGPTELGGKMFDVHTYTNVGRCRRHAPTMSGYPVVFVNDWCGDHKLDENRA